MNNNQRESIVNLLCDRERINNVIYNNVRGRTVFNAETYFKISFYNWELKDGLTVVYDKEPSIIYIIKTNLLTDVQVQMLTSLELNTTN